jgi:uncharacterized protein
MAAEPAPSVFRVGGISYVEIGCRIPSRAADFYEAVFGWAIRRDGDEPAFTDATGHVIGHFVARQVETGEASVRPYVYVEDVDETLQAVIGHGGEIDMPPRPEGTLRVATFRDPEGNLLGVWTRGGHAAVS